MSSDTFLTYIINKADMGPQQPPHERNEKDNDRNLSNTEFSFKYAESGGPLSAYFI
ncbi:MAG: hypothetical protein WBF33_03965 [Candidatus Nitrosopolaris sp.]